MRMHTHDHHIMVSETSQITKFRARFFYNTFYYWLTNLPIGITFFYGPVFLRRVKRTNKTAILQARLFYNVFLYSLTNLPIIVRNSLLLASI